MKIEMMWGCHVSTANTGSGEGKEVQKKCVVEVRSVRYL